MALLFVCLVLQLLFLCPSTNAAENDSCISDYDELRRALRDNTTKNIPTLLNAFYRPNTQDIQVAEITYCISDNKTFCSNEDEHKYFEYKWASSALLFLQEYELINALVFDLFQFNYTSISLIISPPFCEDVDEEDKKNNLRLLTTWLKHYAHSEDNNEFQDYAVHFNNSKDTFDIEVYKKIKKLHYSLLALKYTMVIFTFITLLLRICSKSFAIEIDVKLDKVSNSVSLSKISNFIRGIREEMDDDNEGQSETSNKKSYEYTASYFILLVGFFVWDSIQYKNSKELQKEDWYLFFPIPYIAPIVIGVSSVTSIFLYYVVLAKNNRSRPDTGTKPSTLSSNEATGNDNNEATGDDNTEATGNDNTEATGDDNNEATGDDNNDVCMEDTNIDIPSISADTEDILLLEEKKIPTRATCTCHLRDCIHFPILTGLSVFIVFHGSWMVLMLSAYSNIVIIKSLFLLPTFCFIMVLLPRFIKALCNFVIDRCHRRDICSECKKCKACINNRPNGNNNNPKNHYDCDYCVKCDTCSKRKQCHEYESNVCAECHKCKCDQCQRCIHCKQCTLCEDCKNCEDCQQCRSCKISNFFKLCRDCIEKKKEHKKSFTTIYGFIVIVVIAIPLLSVLYYGSDYILFVTDIHDDILKLLIALVVLLGVPYYLIRIWDSDISGNKNTPKDHQPPPNGAQQDAMANEESVM